MERFTRVLSAERMMVTSFAGEPDNVLSKQHLQKAATAPHKDVIAVGLLTKK